MLGLAAIFAYWRAERRTIRVGFVALVVASTGNLVAGLTLGAITDTLEALPGLIVLVPAAIDMRGNIFGALGSRLGTEIHSGLFEVTRRREGSLRQNLLATTALTLGTSLALAILARGLTMALGFEGISLVDLVVISMVGGVLSSIWLGGITVAVSVQAHKRGWDMDSVAAPLVTAAGDIMTIPSLFLATFLVGIEWVTPAIAIVGALVAVVFTVRGLVTRYDRARRIFQESFPILLFAATVGVLGGLILEARLERFVTFPALLVLVPPFLADAGALGGILSARLASKLHLGVLTPRGRPESLALLDVSIVFLFSVWLFSLVGISADIVAGVFGLASPGALTVVGISVLAGFMATAIAVVVAYYTAVVSFRLGLDPDNHGIPIITSVMDLTGIACLVLAMLAFGVA